MQTVETYQATIYCGLQAGYNGIIEPIPKSFILSYCTMIGLGVTVTPLDFIYSNGMEPGFSVGLINYPRFPDTKENIKRKAIDLAIDLKNLLRQNRVSIVCTDETIMLGEP